MSRQTTGFHTTKQNLAGHSHWANIKRRKEKQDFHRMKISAKISREITTAVKLGGRDESANLMLVAALSKAKAANMPKDTIEHVISKASAEKTGNNYEECVYEGVGPCSVSVIVEALTENRNRTASFLRHAFDKHGGNLSGPGTALWQFQRRGVIHCKRTPDLTEEKLMEYAIESEALDVNIEDDTFEVICLRENFIKVKKYLEEHNVAITNADILYLPTNPVDGSELDEEQLEAVHNFLDAVDDLDDVKQIHHNCVFGSK